MAFSFEYVIDLEACKTEEDPQEQLQLKVPGGQSPNRMTWSRRRGTIRRLKCCSSVDLKYQGITYTVGGNM